MITVTVTGHGSYVIPYEKVQELLNWLAANQAARTESNRPQFNDPRFPGKDLLNG